MNLNLRAAILGCLALCMLNFKAKSQTSATKLVLFDGIIVAGYADHGAYINCTGPAIKYTHKPLSLMLGLLPSLRIKEDKVPAAAPENAMVTPSLGFGLTAVYKHIALQIPMFYNSKTSSADGEWKGGIGLGYKF